MWVVTLWEKVFVKNERKILSELCKINNAVWGKTWCLRKNEIAILRRTEKAIMKARCGVKLIEKKTSQELISLLGLMDTLGKLARATGV